MLHKKEYIDHDENNLFLFFLYNCFNGPFFRLLSKNLQAAKILKVAGDSAGSRCIFTTL